MPDFLCIDYFMLIRLFHVCISYHFNFCNIIKLLLQLNYQLHYECHTIHAVMRRFNVDVRTIWNSKHIEWTNTLRTEIKKQRTILPISRNTFLSCLFENIYTADDDNLILKKCIKRAWEFERNWFVNVLYREVNKQAWSKG